MRFRYLWLFTLIGGWIAAQQPIYLITANRLFDGEQMHTGWGITVQGNRILKVGPVSDLQQNGQDVVDAGDATIIPGMIEGHSHLLLHPYDETSWNDQVLRESLAERIARATIHARKTVEAGFTTVRDLGTEGAGYADIGLKQAIEKGVITGPRMWCAGPAMVATGSYGPKGFADQVDVPQGAIEVDGEGIIHEVRTEIGHGVDVLKIYADYRWGRNGEALPTFTEDEIHTAVQTAASAGRDVVAHAATKEGMLRAIRAGVRTIEHGDQVDREVLQAMLDHHVALCPTLAAPEAIFLYRG
ncbi:MAG: amidohydrolase family protein, partial [Saprospiraceae bacterium]|nr:amidohydrolase family protein [Saprospiraceae bacterium]